MGIRIPERGGERADEPPLLLREGGGALADLLPRGAVLAAAGVGGGFLQAAQLRRLVVAARAGPRRGDLSRTRKVLGCPK